MSSFSSLLPPATSAQSDDHFPEQSTSRPPSTGVKRRQEQSTTITEDEVQSLARTQIFFFIHVYYLAFSSVSWWFSYPDSL